jgi:hypothetical protein
MRHHIPEEQRFQLKRTQWLFSNGGANQIEKSHPFNTEITAWKALHT